ncbi:unnamed protein product [Cuscuta europaea]|uniref:Uncharacterized protein n=1 Tax=Cuscuta europaea TaxID=41803 RepID=A0A9P1EIL0_CUSEU|nr:unnamed protein product [Cuscuta europaea]
MSGWVAKGGRGAAAARVVRLELPMTGLAILALMVTEMGVAQTVFDPGGTLVVWIPIKGGEFRLEAAVGALMKQKYSKYSGDLKTLNTFVIIGLVLDPKFKLRHVGHVLRTVMDWIEIEIFDKESEIKNSC